MNAEEKETAIKALCGEFMEEYGLEFFDPSVETHPNVLAYIFWLELRVIESQPKQLSDEESLWDTLNDVISSHYGDCSSLPELIDGFGVRKDGKNLSLWEAIKVALDEIEAYRDRTGGEVDEQVERFKQYRYFAWKIQYGGGLSQDEYEQYEELREEMQHNVADYLTHRNQQDKG